jgi:putative IMPACT (imprinted ancient) family translation regulator
VSSVTPTAADAYAEPARAASCELRVRGSRFLADVAVVRDEAETHGVLDHRRRTFHDATHIAYACRLRPSGGAIRARSSDAGEPSGTAGRPILIAIESAGVVNALVTVTRWFGGTKLGTGGLARAYGEAAARALAAAGTAFRFDVEELTVECGYDAVALVKRVIAPPEVTVRVEEFGTGARFVLAVRQSRVAEIAERLAAAGLRVRPSGA